MNMLKTIIMDHQTLVDQTIKKLENVSDEQRKAFAPGYYPTSMEVLGVKTNDLREVVKDLLKQIKGYEDADYLDLCKALAKTEIFECRQVAYELLDRRRKMVGRLNEKQIEELSDGNDNWVSVDTFSVLISGIAWREGGISDKTVLEWLRSGNRWIRRTAVVSTIALNQKSRGGTGDVRRTLMVCEKVVEDKDDMAQKALSWALRELSKRERKPVEEFMEKYNEHLSGRVRREVSRKLQTGRKN
jgi:3-methyladenine DNA glycosylase AlkD